MADGRPRADAGGVNANIGLAPAEKIRIFLMRHSKSCSNMLRESSAGKEYADSIKRVSKKVKDTPLSKVGTAMATAYAPTLVATLKSKGFLTAPTTIGASELLRAQQTARIIFGDSANIVVFPHLAEKGDIEENTPMAENTGEDQATQIQRMANTGKARNDRFRNPDPKKRSWAAFKEWLFGAITEHPEMFVSVDDTIYVIAVGHKTYLETEVLANVENRPAGVTLGNMDGFILEADSSRTFRFVEMIQSTLSTANTNVTNDACELLNNGERTLRPFPIRKYTQDPSILAYEDALEKLFYQVIDSLKLPYSLKIDDILELLQSAGLENQLAGLTKDPILKAIFRKLYANHDANETPWPPTDYPASGPALWKVPGYAFETADHFNMRLLTIMGNLHAPQMIPEEVFMYLRNKIDTWPIATETIEIRGPKILLEFVNNLTLSDADRAELTTGSIDTLFLRWARTGEIEGKTILMNLNTAGRFMTSLGRSTTWEEYLLDQQRNSAFTEFAGGLINTIISPSVLIAKESDPNQQVFVFAPPSTPRTTPILNDRGEPIINMRWKAPDLTRDKFKVTPNILYDQFEVPYSATVSIQFETTLFEEEIPYDTQSGLYERAIVMQGYRMRTHPDLRRMLLTAVNPPKLSDHAAKLLPEWKTIDGCRAWVNAHESPSEWFDRSVNYMNNAVKGARATYEAYKEMIEATPFTLDGRKALQVVPPRERIESMLAGPKDDFLAKNQNLFTETVEEWYARSRAFVPQPEQQPNGSTLEVDPYEAYKAYITSVDRLPDGRRALQLIPEKGLYAKILTLDKAGFISRVTPTAVPVEESETRIGVNLQVIADLAGEPSIDPNAVYQKFATWKEQYARPLAKKTPQQRALIDAIGPRDKRLLLGTSKDRYRKTLKAALNVAIGQLGTTGADSTQRLLALAESPTPDTKAIWSEFQGWRDSGIPNEMFRREIEKITAPGFFTSAKTYATRIADLVRRATSISSQLTRNLKEVLRTGGRGDELKERVKTLKAKPEYALRRANLDRILSIDKETAYDDTVRTKIQELAQIGGNNTFDTGSSRMRSRKQSGGGLPLAYFRDSAQMAGTYAEPTGVGLAGSAGAWARAPLDMRGGRRTRRLSRRSQQGGFSPSIMGSFAANGAALLPIAAYMGFKMWKNGKRATRKGPKSRKTGK